LVDFKERQTPIIAAVRCKKLQVAQLLIQHGADLFHRAKKGRTALVAALESQDKQMTRMLFSEMDQVLKDDKLHSGQDSNALFRSQQNTLSVHTESGNYVTETKELEAAASYKNTQEGEGKKKVIQSKLESTTDNIVDILKARGIKMEQFIGQGSFGQGYQFIFLF
jgi:hypothetical protein